MSSGRPDIHIWYTGGGPVGTETLQRVGSKLQWRKKMCDGGVAAQVRPHEGCWLFVVVYSLDGIYLDYLKGIRDTLAEAKRDAMAYVERERACYRDQAERNKNLDGECVRDGNHSELASPNSVGSIPPSPSKTVGVWREPPTKPLINPLSLDGVAEP